MADVPEGSEKIRNVPLEVFVKGDKEPMYSATFDDDGRGGYASVLPFNAYGALGMAREEYNVDSASSQYFWLLFDSDLTPVRHARARLLAAVCMRHKISLSVRVQQFWEPRSSSQYLHFNALNKSVTCNWWSQ